MRLSASFIPLCYCIFFTFTAHSFAGDTRNIFLSWLAHEDPILSQEIINRSNQKFREQFGFLQTRYSNRAEGQWSPAFLAVAEKSFEEKTGKSISAFCNLTNEQMKSGLSAAASRFTDASKEKFSEVYTQYLATNLTLAKSGREVSTTEANKEIWHQHTRIAALESMGGNAGAGALAVNFLYDNQGRIVFVGNIQDAPADIKTHYYNKRLHDGTVRYAVDEKVWQLFTPKTLDPQLKDQLVRDLTSYHGSPPQPSHEAFEVQCALALKRLLGR